MRRLDQSTRLRAGAIELETTHAGSEVRRDCAAAAKAKSLDLRIPGNSRRRALEDRRSQPSKPGPTQAAISLIQPTPAGSTLGSDAEMRSGTSSAPARRCDAPARSMSIGVARKSLGKERACDKATKSDDVIERVSGALKHHEALWRHHHIAFSQRGVVQQSVRVAANGRPMTAADIVELRLIAIGHGQSGVKRAAR